MLAYTFWHWKRPDVSPERYEARQRDFQASLAAHPPDGFLQGTTLRVQGAPWAADGRTAYEDWYLVRDMASLDSLNQAAVTAARQVPHDAVAQLAENGIAGLYRLRAGAPVFPPPLATWFHKPTGMSYPALSEALAPVIAAIPAALWMRQMTLGPTPEFCLHTKEPVTLPAGFAGPVLTLTPVWTGKTP